MSMNVILPPVGTRIRVTQQTTLRDRTWSEAIEGEITQFHQAETGSWFAHALGDRFWLDRLELRLDDGELMVLNLDQFSVLEIID